MIDVAFIGDLHLDKLSGILPNANALQIKEAEKVFEYAQENGISNVIFLGDIGEKHSLSEEASILFCELLRSYPKITKRIILGNHDFANDGTHSLTFLKYLNNNSFFKNVRIYTQPKSVPIGGVEFFFLPYPYTAFNVQDRRPFIKIAHIEIAGTKRDNGCVALEGIELPKSKDYWVIGHLHTRQKGKRYYYPGTLFQTNFGESLPKGFLHLNARYKDDALDLKKTWIKNDPSFTLTNLEIQTKHDFAKVDSNPLHLYKIFIKDGVTLPENFLVEHPNVVKSVGFKTKKELTVLRDEQIIEINGEGLDEFSPYAGAHKFIKEKATSKKHARRAIALLNEAKNAGLKD